MKKTGFTLIELLAVIVILAIIALIAVPIVINIINDAKKSSEERTMDLYIDTVEKSIAQENLKRKYNPTTCEIQENGNVKCSGDIDNNAANEILKVETKGQTPNGGTIIIENGKITDIIDLVINGGKYNYDNNSKNKLLETPTAPGLYDENYKLLASWDELIEDYNLSISNNSLNDNLGNIIKNNKKLSNTKLVIIADGIISMRGTFSGCKNLKTVVIPNSVKYIGHDTFRDCLGLVSITIPSSVTDLENDDTVIFYNCPKLSSIKVDPNNQVYEDRGANAIIEKSTNTLVHGCKSTVIPDSVTSIGESAFHGCTGLISITIPSNVTSIGWESFRDCINLTSVTIENGITSIGSWAFRNCTRLASITIPSSVTSIGDSPFSGCTDLTSIKVELGNITYEDRGANAIIEKSTNTLIIGCKNTIIPNSVISIGGQAFYDCINLTSITIPNSVTSIGYGAFSGCTGLTNIIIPNSVTSIGSWAFSNCINLASITIPNSVTSIGQYAFSGCTALTSITIPNSVTSIGQNSFSGCTALTSITIPNSVTSIGYYAFYGCTGLTNIIIPNGVTSIGSTAFRGCTGLTSIKVESGNTTYEDRGANAIIEKSTNTLIIGCKNTIIPNSVTSIGGQAFYNCTGLTSITIPSSVTSIGESAFYGCTGLTSVTFNNTTGWFTTYSSSATTGTSIDVTNASTNANNLVNTHTHKYWKRS